MGKSTISMVIFNSFLYVYQAGWVPQSLDNSDSPRRAVHQGVMGHHTQSDVGGQWIDLLFDAVEKVQRVHDTMNTINGTWTSKMRIIC